ncbi:MAG: hypothetical protein F6J98_17500 [Moorea sp. SIO4G2]|nr:hypothetical protein [Moorena sp. SIO4G2]
MKSKLALISASTTLAVITAASAMAYGSHEHVFYRSRDIKSMTQIQGNGYCNHKFKQLKATGDLGGGFNPNRVNHVWAHIGNGHCVANTW